MVILIGGSTHTGKTYWAHELVKKYHYSCLSLDHLKMGLIRSGYTTLTPMDDNRITAFLWPIVREIIKTAIENKQDMIIEGCYFPYDYRNDFEARYLQQINMIWLVMTEEYIRNHFYEIKKYANVVEERLDDAHCCLETLIQDNLDCLNACRERGENVILIEKSYPEKLEI